MPLLLGFGLVALFIWISENIGSFAKAWIYPNQTLGWSPVSFGKYGSWFLLMLISYAMVSAINRLSADVPARKMERISRTKTKLEL